MLSELAPTPACRPILRTTSPGLGREHGSGLPRPDWGSGPQPGGVELEIRTASEPLRVRRSPLACLVHQLLRHLAAHEPRVLLRFDDTRPGPESTQTDTARASGVFSRDCAEPGPTTMCPPSSSVGGGARDLVESGRPPAGWGGAGGVCQVRLPSRVGGAPLDVDSSLRMAEVCVLSHQALHPPRAAAAAHPTELQEEYPVSNRRLHGD